MKDISQLMLCIAPHIPLQQGLDFAFGQFPDAEFTLIAKAGRKIPNEYREKVNALDSLSRRTPGDVLDLIREIRKTGYDAAVCVGEFLPYLWFIYFTGANGKFFSEGVRRASIIKRIGFGYLSWKTLSILMLWLMTLPVAFFLMIVFQIEGLLTRNIRKVRSSNTAPADTLRPPVSVVIPNYNGKELLAECLPSVIAAVSKAPFGSEVIVVDDGSCDGSAKFLLEEFRQIRVIPLHVNQGFGKACNAGVSSAKNRVVILLNSDVMVKENFLFRLTEHFIDEKVFAVQPKILAWDEDSLNGGANFPEMIYGYFLIENEAERQRTDYVDEPCPNFYAIGGAMAFDRVKWEMLEGFDSLYAPFCWEDIDISYRALKRGWKVLYESRSEVIHKHHATLSKVFKSSYKKQIERRNELLFTWKNLHDYDRVTRHFLFLPGHLLYRFFIDGNRYLLSVLKAVSKTISVLRRRVKEKKYAVVCDREIMQQMTSSYKHRHLKQRTKPAVLVLAPFSPYPPSDGGRLRVYTLIRLLSYRYDFHLLSFIENNEQALCFPELKKVCKTVDFVLRANEHKSLFNVLKDWVSLPFHYIGFSTNAMKNKLREVLELQQPDIVQTEFSLMSPYLGLNREFPSIYIEHDISIISGNSYNPPFKGWKRLIEYIDRFATLRLEKKSCRLADCVVTVTDVDRHILRQHVPEARIETVSTGTDLDYFSREYKGVANRNIVFVGSMGHFPNVDASLYFCAKIFPRIKEEFPDAAFTIVGSGRNAEVSSLAENNPFIRVTGYVEDVRPYIDEAEVFVAPMRKGAGIKGKLLEAMAMCKPMVTTSIGSQGIGIEPERDFLLADDPDVFAKQVLRLFRNPELKRSLAVNAKKICREHYDWRIKAGQMEKIYESLLGDSK